MKLYKKQLFTILIWFISIGTVEANSLEASIKKFQENCMSSAEISLETVVGGENISCEQFALELEEKMNGVEASEAEATSLNEPLSAEVVCDPDGESLESKEIENLIEDANTITARVQCEPKAVEENKKICGKLFQCNMMRSVASASDTLLPEMISKKIDGALEKKVQSSGLPKDCLDSSRGDCLTEVVTSLIGNLWSTVTSVWDLVKAGSSSLFSVSSWFDSKAEDAHIKAVQTEDDVKTFISDPVAFISDKFTKFKNVVDEWVKSTVLCQQWEGEPHLSECKTKLQSYDCVDCDHKINATCAAIGAITSEVGMMILTAGVGNVASLTARVGAKALASASRVAVANIKKVAPGLNVGKAGDKVNDASKLTNAAVKTAQVAKVAAISSMKYFKDGKALVSKYLTKVSELKVVQASLKVADAITDPLGASRRLSRVGVNLSNRAMTHVGTDVTKRHARVSLLVDKRYHERQMVKRVLDKRDDHAVRNVSIKSSRIASHTVGSKKSDLVHGTVSEHGQKPSSNTKGPRENHFVPEHSSGQKQTNHNTNTTSNTSTSKKGPEIQLKAEQKPTNKPKSDQGGLSVEASSSKDKKDRTSLGGANLLGALAIADIGNKIAGGEEESRSEMEKKAADQLRAENSNKHASVAEKASEALGAKSFSQMKVNAEKLSEIYDDKNKNKMVEQIIKNTGVSREVADQIYDQRKQEVLDAKKYVDTVANDSSNVSAKSQDIFGRDISEQDEFNKIMAQASKTKSLKKFDELDAKRSELEEKLKALNNGMGDDRASTSRSPSASATSKAPVRNIQGPRVPSSISSGLPSSSSVGGTVSSNQVSSNNPSVTSVNQGPIINSTLPGGSVAGEGKEPKALVDELAVAEEAQVIDIKYQKAAVKNLLKVVNQENVDLLNDVAMSDFFTSTAKGLDDQYIKRAQDHLENKSVAKYKITKLLPAQKKIEVYEFEDGEQFSVLSDNGKTELISNEKSEEYFLK